MSRDERFDDMNKHVYHPKFMKKEGGGKWDFQLVSKRVEIAMPVTSENDHELTTASHGINCRTIWEAQTRDPTTKELVKFLDPKDKESNKWPEEKIKAMMTRTKKFVLCDGFIFWNGDKYINW